MLRPHLFICLLSWLSATAAHAASGAWARSDMVSARLVSAVEATGDLARIPLGLEIKLDPDWKIYWRSPGEAGLPPAIDWAGSTGFGAAALSWPAPHRFTLLGVDTFGYKDAITLPIAVTPASPGAALTLKARVDLLVCARICVPKTLDLALALPAGPAAPGPEAQALNRAQAAIPDDGRASGLSIERARFVGSGPAALLQVEARSASPFQTPDLVPESDTLAFGHPEIVLSEAGRRASITLPVLNAPAGAAPQGALTLTLLDAGRALEARPKLEAAPMPGLIERLAALLPFLGIALLGGLILNVMPCVLPVLSIKLLSVASQGGQARAKIRAGFLASALGVVAAFILMAAALIGVKAAGGAIGWGVQFQQPIFLAALALALGLFAGNLWGLFEIALPGALANRLGQAGGEGLIGHFASGAFATVLATPCSAPFLGTAVGFALAGGPLEIFAVFLALGLGLAAPFLLVAAFPGLAARLPRPGAWMARLRQALGGALALTAAWLLWVVSAQIGVGPAALIALAMAALVAAMTLRAPARALAGGLVAAGVAIAVAALAPLSSVRRDDAAPTVHWARFDDGQIRSLVAQGKTVFVDVTADWCLTCQANRRLVLDEPAVAARLNAPSLAAMKADWTRPDEKIAAYLARYGKYGIPFNVVYGPKAPAGVVLPELLTRDALLKAMADAG